MFDILGSDSWRLHHGDCIPHMHSMPPASVDFAIFSPPFPSLYAYTDSESDIGNVDDAGDEAKVHLSFLYHALARILKPGRVAIVHVAQIPRMKRSGKSGLCNFRDINARLGERAGLVFEYDWSVRKNPQAQAIRTKSRELQFAGLESDRAKQRGTLQDYLLKFRAPGENAVSVDSPGQVSRNDWIAWAEGCWSDIIETDTLNVRAAKGEGDVKHICPLQLEVIRRCVLLFTNPDEIVFSPFAGIGSEGFMAVGGTSPKTGKRIADPRRFYGCELKDEYFDEACKNIADAESAANAEKQAMLF